VSLESKKFQKKSEDIAFDIKHRDKIKFNISRYNAAVEKGELRYADINIARNRAAAQKREVLKNLHTYLLQFEEKAIANNNEVLWAQDSEEAIGYIQDILKTEKAKLVVKSKSMTTEEIEFNEGAEAIGVKSVETDLGEYIVQVAGEKPYHIVTPAMHKSKQDIADLFHVHFGTDIDGSPEYLTNFVREKLRDDFINADIGVTGANFLLADIGGIAVTENEGNAIMSASFPKTHIVIAGIEKIIPSYKDLGTFWPLLSAHGTGQQMTVYNTIYTSAKKDGEIDGPERMIIILLDNGRSELYSQPTQAESLSCIRCGACLNACPIYKNIGGYTYDATYSGPIGSVITPHFKHFGSYKHLSFACSLCGRCEEVCPVKIPLPKLLLHNRKDSVERGNVSFVEKMSTNFTSSVFQSRALMDFLPGSLKNAGLTMVQSKLIGDKRKLDGIAKESFSKQWSKKRK